LLNKIRRLWPEDIDLVHDIWLRLSEKFGSSLHHCDAVGVASRRMNRELESQGEDGVLAVAAEELKQRHKPEARTEETRTT
jgi:hypothetical protein